MYNQVRQAPSSIFGSDGSWFNRSRSTATDAVVRGISISGLARTSAAVPAPEAALIVTVCTLLIPVSPEARGMKGQ